MSLVKILTDLEHEYKQNKAFNIQTYIINTAHDFNLKCNTSRFPYQTTEKEYNEAKSTLEETKKVLESTKSEAIKQTLEPLLQEKQKLVEEKEKELYKQHEAEKNLTLSILLDASTGNLYFPIFWEDYHKQEELALTVIDHYKKETGISPRKEKNYIVIPTNKRILKNKNRKKLGNLTDRISKDLEKIKLKLNIVEIDELDNLLGYNFEEVPKQNKIDLHLTIGETIERLKVNLEEVNRLIKENKLKVKQIDGKIYIPEKSIEDITKNYHHIKDKWVKALTIKETADVLGINPNTVFWAVYKKNGPINREYTVLEREKGLRKRLYIDENEILRYMELHEKKKTKKGLNKIERLIRKYNNKLNIPLTEFKIPTRARKIFNQLEFKTIRDLAQKTEDELRSCRGYGALTSSIIKRQILEPLGLDYRDYRQ